MFVKGGGVSVRLAREIVVITQVTGDNGNDSENEYATIKDGGNIQKKTHAQPGESRFIHILQLPIWPSFPGRQHES